MGQPHSGENTGQPPLQPGAPQTPAGPTSQSTWNDSFNQLDTYAEQLRTKLPLPPPGLIDGYMSVAPWVFIVLGVFGVLGSLALMGLGAIFTPFLVLFGGAAGVTYGGGIFLVVFVGLLGAILDIVGGYMMYQRRATGWWLIALSLLIGLISNLVYSSLLILIVYLLVAYIHLQVKPNYK
jgi:hypothetical protein